MNTTEPQVRTDDWQAALDLLNKKRAIIDQQIRVVMQEIDKAKRDKTDAIRTKATARRERLARLVLMQGMTIMDAARATATNGVYARTLLHEHCRRTNPQLYRSGFHHNVYADGSENDCVPLLDFLRENAASFFP